MPPDAPKNPNKIMGLPKWAFWLILAGGLLLAFYLYKKNQQNSQDQTANSGVSPTYGLTAADIGGTPSDYGTPYDTSGGQVLDNSAQITALGDQLQSSLTDLSSQISALAGSGIGPSAASAPQSNNTLPTLPIDVTVNTQTSKPKPKHKVKVKKPVHHRRHK
jgi:hypothetical protein